MSNYSLKAIWIAIKRKDNPLNWQEFKQLVKINKDPGEPLLTRKSNHYDKDIVPKETTEVKCSLCQGTGLSTDEKRICISCGGEGEGDMW